MIIPYLIGKRKRANLVVTTADFSVLPDDTATDTVMLYVILNKRKLVAIQYYHVYSMGLPATVYVKS